MKARDFIVPLFLIFLMIAVLMTANGCAEPAYVTTTMAGAKHDCGVEDAGPSATALKDGHKYVVATTPPEPCDCSQCLDCTVGIDGETPSGRPWDGCRIFCSPLDNQTCVDCGECITQPGSVDCAEIIRLEAESRGN